MKFAELDIVVWKVVQFPEDISEIPINLAFTSDTKAVVVYANYMTSSETKLAVRESISSDWQGELTTITGGMVCWFLDDKDIELTNYVASQFSQEEVISEFLRGFYHY